VVRGSWNWDVPAKKKSTFLETSHRGGERRVTRKGSGEAENKEGGGPKGQGSRRHPLRPSLLGEFIDEGGISEEVKVSEGGPFFL